MMSPGILLVVLLSLCSLVAANSTVCYPPLGCFPNDGFWRSDFRQNFPPPQSPEDVGTTLVYYDRYNATDGKAVYKNLQFHMNNTGFDKNRVRTFFVVHGFIESGNTSWVLRMKNALLTKMDANVFVVDWGDGAIQLNYGQAASNTRTAGAEVARFIKYLQNNYKLDLSLVHLIGHSLGAQVMSYAGKNLSGIDRVTGLDAAQPGFEGLPKEGRIDKSDAKFVDLIHTNIKPFIPSLGMGMYSPVGHVDIYVNGGLDQPGCHVPQAVNRINLEKLYKIPLKVLTDWGSCSHRKSVEYFIASMSTKCKIWARLVTKANLVFGALTEGVFEPVASAFHKCTSDTCTVLGLDTPKYNARGTCAATTTRRFPYCDEVYDVDDGSDFLSKLMNKEKKEQNFYL